MFNTTEPLGLPKGSVRAIIALMLNAVGCYLFAVSAPISPEFVGLLMMVDGFYFLSRQQKDGEPAEPTLADPVVG